MRTTQLVGPAIVLGGLAAVVLALVRGEARLFLILIVPAVVGTGPLAFVGIGLVFVGLFLTFFLWSAPALLPPASSASTPSAAPPEAPPTRRWGGVAFLGPIPLVFGSDAGMARWMLILGVVLFLALLGLTLALLLA